MGRGTASIDQSGHEQAGSILGVIAVISHDGPASIREDGEGSSVGTWARASTREVGQRSWKSVS